MSRIPVREEHSSSVYPQYDHNTASLERTTKGENILMSMENAILGTARKHMGVPEGESRAQQGFTAVTCRS